MPNKRKSARYGSREQSSLNEGRLTEISRLIPDSPLRPTSPTFYIAGAYVRFSALAHLLTLGNSMCGKTESVDQYPPRRPPAVPRHRLSASYRHRQDWTVPR